LPLTVLSHRRPQLIVAMDQGVDYRKQARTARLREMLDLSQSRVFYIGQCSSEVDHVA